MIAPKFAYLALVKKRTKDRLWKGRVIGFYLTRQGTMGCVLDLAESDTHTTLYMAPQDELELVESDLPKKEFPPLVPSKS